MKPYKTIILVLISAICCFALAKPQRGIVAADWMEFPEEIESTAQLYIQDGLVVALDSLENSGFGLYNPDVTEWVNLGEGGSDFNATILSGGFSDHGFTGTSILQKPHCSEITVSIVIAQLPNTSLSQSNDPFDAIDSTGGYRLYQHPLNGVHRFRWIIARNSTGASWQPAFISVDEGIPLSYTFTAQSTGYKETYVNGVRSQIGIGGQGGYSDGERQSMMLGHPNQIILRLAIYNRPLSESEIAYNYSINQMRFGL